ncbi:MAG TPA: hypothetical protein VNC82_14535 [Candidatus Limnocylindria bacterium]|nr:hypothetical protein [Candidatus Limnocylindria bacterium]
MLFLALGGWESITNGIFAFYIAGSANEAAALGVILIVVAAVSVAIINRVAGARMGGVFGQFGSGLTFRHSHLPNSPSAGEMSECKT